MFLIASNIDLYLLSLKVIIFASIPGINTSGTSTFNQKVLSQSFVSKDYYRMDVNGDNNLSITDVYLTFMRILGRSWKPGVLNYRIFTVTEWNTINKMKVK